MTGRQLGYVIAGQWERAGLEPPRVLPWDRVHIARRALESTECSFGDDPRVIAASLGLKVVPTLDRGCGAEWAAEGVVVYAWRAERRERGLRMFHGIAHALLSREHWDCSHADAWILTMELAAPHAFCRRLEAEDVVREAHAPEDAVRAWVAVSRSLGRRFEIA